jgi:NAD(P)-dependent dehydrogenase (short-subunit alcohol dehydrogenase family)
MLEQFVLITGATGGIGRETALGLARLGVRVVAVGRDPLKLEALVQLARAENLTLETLQADLSSLAQVRQLADDFKATFGHLDVLINNAGVTPNSKQITVDGLEMQFMVNYLAPFLLTQLLLEPLRASESSRVINVASSAASMGRIDFENLQSEKTYNMTQAYARSKLALLMFNLSLAKRLEPQGITVNALDPGWIDTSMTQGMETAGGLLGAVNRLAKHLPFLRKTAAQGAENSIYLASSPALVGVTGRFFSVRHQETRVPKSVQDPNLRQQLWLESLRLAQLESEL